jgi:hypothetical protein
VLVLGVDDLIEDLPLRDEPEPALPLVRAIAVVILELAEDALEHRFIGEHQHPVSDDDIVTERGSRLDRGNGFRLRP